MKSYLCKWLPPRVDFLPTMTQRERDLMDRHGGFLDDLLHQGVIIAHGPVLEDNGGYGVSLYQIADNQQVEAFTSQDPLVKDGVGHYVHFPMLHIHHRG